MTDLELYNLCRAAKAHVNSDGDIVVPCPIPDDLTDALKRNKAEIVDALSGYCFHRDVQAGCGLRNWAIFLASAIADVSYPAEMVFTGTAREVDAWAKAHRDDPFFTDKYTSKYSYCAV